MVSSTPRLCKYTEKDLSWAGRTGLVNFGPKYTFLVTSNSSVKSESSFLGATLYSTWQGSPYLITELRLALAKLYLKMETELGQFPLISPEMSEIPPKMD